MDAPPGLQGQVCPQWVCERGRIVDVPQRYIHHSIREFASTDVVWCGRMSLSSEQTVTYWRLVLGVKPISLFGMVHSLRRENMRDAFTRDYPQIHQDISGFATGRGFLALVHDHVIDLGFLVEADWAPSVTERQDEESVFDGGNSTYPLNPRTSTSGESTGGNVVDGGESSRQAVQR